MIRAFPSSMISLVVAALLSSAAIAAPFTSLQTQDLAWLSCVNNTSNGTLYTSSIASWQILCGFDYTGGNVTTVTTQTFEGCITACENQLGCVHASYSGTTCHLKDKFSNTPVAHSTAWSARSLIYGDLFNCTASGSRFKATNNGTYLIQCGLDHAGGSLKSQNTISFAACINLCDSTAGCVDVSYTSPACYLKSKLSTGYNLSSVWTAQKVSSSSTSSNPFRILSAYWADRDVTVAAQKNFLVGTRMVINTSALNTEMGGDPWYDTRKSVAVLYEYLGEKRVFTALENTGRYTTSPGALNTAYSRGSYALSSDDQILSVLYGGQQMTLTSGLAAVDSYYVNGSAFQVTNVLFGTDPLPGTVKSAVFFYRDSNGNLKTAASKENGWITL